MTSFYKYWLRDVSFIIVKGGGWVKKILKYIVWTIGNVYKKFCGPWKRLILWCTLTRKSTQPWDCIVIASYLGLFNFGCIRVLWKKPTLKWLCHMLDMVGSQFNVGFLLESIWWEISTSIQWFLSESVHHFEMSIPLLFKAHWPLHKNTKKTFDQISDCRVPVGVPWASEKYGNGNMQ